MLVEEFDHTDSSGLIGSTCEVDEFMVIMSVCVRYGVISRGKKND